MKTKKIIKLYESGKLGGFGTALFELIARAEIKNQRKLGKVFPEYLDAYRVWINSGYRGEKHTVLKQIKEISKMDIPKLSNFKLDISTSAIAPKARHYLVETIKLREKELIRDTNRAMVENGEIRSGEI